MKLKKPKIFSKYVVDVQTLFNEDDFKKSDDRDSCKINDNTHQSKLVEGSNKSYCKIISSNDIYVDSKGIYHYSIPHCSKCGSTNVIKHDTNETSITLKDGTKHKIRVKKYNCKTCGKSSQVEFPDEFKPYSHVSNEVDEMIKKMNSLHWISLRDILKILKITLGIELSHEYIRKIQLTTDKLYWRNEEIFNPNRISYDVQWIPVDKGWVYLHVLVDLDSKNIIALELTEDEEKETTEKFFKKSFNAMPQAMVTDLKPGYHELIYDKFHIEHQQCKFHFKNAFSRKITKEINKIKNMKIGEILNSNPDISDYELKNQIDEYLEDIKLEYDEYKQEVFKIYDMPSFEEAVDYAIDLRNRVNEYPKAICIYLKEHFFPIYRSLILYKHRDFKGKIPSTNNITENIIGGLATKFEKRKYRTELGFFNHILARINYRGQI
jgi:transcription elongation factor Elf1